MKPPEPQTVISDFYSGKQIKKAKDFDGLTLITSHACQRPMVILSFINKDGKPFILSSQGLEDSEALKVLIFSTHTINSSLDFFEINNTLKDKRFANESCVIAAPAIASYSAIVLKDTKNEVLGTLSVMNTKPGKLSQSQKNIFRALSIEFIDKLKRRKLKSKLNKAKKKFVAERKTADIARKKSYLQSISESLAKVGHWEVKLENNNVYWSEETKKIHEVADDYIPNLEEGINFYDEKSRPIITKAVQESIGKGTTWDLTLQIVTAKGNKKWVRTIGEAYGAKDKKTSIIGVFQDINNEKLIQDKMLENQKMIEELNQQLKSKVKEQAKRIDIVNDKYELLYQEAPDMMVSVDPNTARIIECNDTLLNKTGYKREEIINSLVFDFYHPDCINQVNEAFEAFKEVGIVSNKKLILKKKNNELIHVALNVKAVYDNEGNIVRSNSIWRDIDDLVEAENKLNELNKQLESIVKTRTEQLNLALKNLEDFTYITTHDLKSPISTIKGYTNVLDELLDDSSNLSPMVSKSLNWIRDSTKEAESKINSVLELVNAKGVIDFEFFTIKNFIDAIFKSVSEKNPTVECAYKNEIDHEFELYFNQAKFKRIVENIISNAFKYKKLNRNLHLYISATTENKNIIISFKDNGLGFDSTKSAAKVFSMFTRLHDHVEGNGMGLHLTKKILETYNGNIEVSSQVDKGSNFRIIIPNHEKIK